MDIVVASDENYVPHLATLICSVYDNNKDENIVFHIFDNGISEESYRKIEKLKKISEGRCTFVRYTVTDDEIKKRIGCDLAKDRSLSTYARILIPEILDKNIEVALYLDVDAIVKGSLLPLYSLPDFENYAIAGVRDINPAERRYHVGLEPQDLYVNAGMLVWNLVYCRNNNITKKLIEFIRKKEGNVDAMDQGTINGVLKNCIYELHPKYNAMTPFFQLNAEELAICGGWKKYYSDELLKEAVETPIFIHFTPNMTTRPWVKGCKHPLKNSYIKYRNMTEFQISNLMSDNRNVKLKILSWFFYHVPYKVYYKFLKLH